MNVAISTAFEQALSDLITKYMTEINADRLANAMEIQITALRENAGTFLRVAYLIRN